MVTIIFPDRTLVRGNDPADALELWRTSYAFNKDVSKESWPVEIARRVGLMGGRVDPDLPAEEFLLEVERTGIIQLKGMPKTPLGGLVSA